MTKKHLLGIAIATTTLLSTQVAKAQGLSVNTSGTPADGSAMMDVSSTSKGMLVPRMDSTHRATIASPANGLLVYQTDGVTPGFYYNSGTAGSPLWKLIGSGASAGGDLTGAYPNPTIANNAITSAKIADGSIVNNDINSAAAIAYGKLNLSNSIIAGDLAANSVTIAKLPTGSGSAATYLNGAGAWTTPAGGGGGGFVVGATFSQTQTTPKSMGIITSGDNADIMPVACTIDAFYVSAVVVATYLTGGNNVFTGTIYLNGVATAATITFTLGTTDAEGAVVGPFSDLAHPVAVSAGDAVSVKWTQSNPGVSASTGGELAVINCSFHAH